LKTTRWANAGTDTKKNADISRDIFMTLFSLYVFSFGTHFTDLSSRHDPTPHFKKRDSLVGASW